MALRHIFKGFSFARRLLAVGPDQDSGHLCPGQRRLRVEGVGGSPRHNASLVQRLHRCLTGQTGDVVKSCFRAVGACAGQ